METVRQTEAEGSTDREIWKCEYESDEKFKSKKRSGR